MATPGRDGCLVFAVKLGLFPNLFGTIVAARRSLLWDTAKRLNIVAQGQRRSRATLGIRSMESSEP